MGRVRGRLAALMTLAGLAALPAAARADFYTPPSPLPAGQPGDVIRAEPTTADLLPAVPLPARAWRILYRSTDANGRPDAVSGTILVPRAKWTGKGRRPIIGYAVGTQGLATNCAASGQLASGTEYEASFIAQMLSRGWAVAVTDYPGLGTPGVHPYVVGRALGPAVLDSVRAAIRLRVTALNRYAPIAIYGYSEGGEGAGWALQLAHAYAPTLRLTGGAVGAAPANFDAEYNYLNGGRLSFLIMYTAIGMNSAYPQLHLERYLNAAGQAFEVQMRNSCIENAILEAQLEPTSLSAYVTTNPVTQPDWQHAFARNNLGAIAPKVPVFLGAGQHDEVMDYATAGPGLYHAWCSRGANVTFDEIPLGVEHIVDAAPFAAGADDFLAARLGGQKPARAADCVPAH